MMRLSVKHLNRLAFAIAVVATALLLSIDNRRAAADDEENLNVTWRYEGGATEVDLMIPTPFDNVKDFIPSERWGNIVRFDVGGTEMTMLFFDLKRIPRTIVTTTGGEYSQDDTIELIVSVLYASGDPADTDIIQFYTLVRLGNFAKLVATQNRIGLPARYVPNLALEFNVDSLTGLGTAAVDAPWPVSPFSAAAQVAYINTDELTGTAGEFFDGPHGLIRVTHRGTVAVNPAEGTVTAADENDVLAHWMGGTSASGTGLFLKFNPANHALTARIIRPKN